ncbi:MAG: tyrosine--tRNA ligase, partial [Acidaminococcaceae bacterium]|nr:tyrosine--tRNA ligase [Acidaminococcaceae bacterium]
TFFEFNYMIMQAYDFLTLKKKYNCVMELGGDDQWSNMLAGVELIRRKEQKPAFCMTSKLLTTSTGEKMGKTVGGALWLDPAKTSPYDFYQYWRNVDDADVENCLSLLTFLPMDEVHRLGALRDSAINEAKIVLAYEVTKLIHGEAEAQKAKEAAEALFSGGGNMDDVPTIDIAPADLGGKLLDVLCDKKLFASKSEGRRLIQQGGLTVNEEKISDIDTLLTSATFQEGTALLRKGKKKYYKLVLQ